jgi:myo-inositol-1(or 4)-monophosphatase
MPSPTPKQILETLLPHLRVAAAYAKEIQSRIAAQPEKESDNIFVSALTDADLSVQTFVEVLMLGHFPTVRFYGEEHEKSYNTKYFRSIELGPQDDYLVTLDPIDGTRFYLDGHSNYQIMLNVLNADGFEAALVIRPVSGRYFYALRGQGLFGGMLGEALEACQPVRIEQAKPCIYLGGGAGKLKPQLVDRYEVLDIHADYSAEVQVPSTASFLEGELCGAVLMGAQFIDGAAFAFMAQEAGALVTQLDGSPLPPLSDYADTYRWPPLVIGATAAVHGELLAAARATVLA